MQQGYKLTLEIVFSITYQVESMSIELEDAKTKVAQFQKQCEEYLVVIVQQKRDADEQQKVCSVFHCQSLTVYVSFRRACVVVSIWFWLEETATFKSGIPRSTAQ